MASIGHRTGLFDTMSGLLPSTSEEIAKKAGLNERYVREWLGAMVTARVLDVDPTSTQYVLPPEHAAFLTRAAAADNVAVFAQYIALMGSVEDDIVECFKKGGGVAYEKFPIPRRDGRRQRAVRAFLARIPRPSARAGIDRPPR
jgi:hypothetical protein